MGRVPGPQQTPSEQEIAAQNAESRKATAEGELAIVLQDKKNVQADIAQLIVYKTNAEADTEAARVSLVSIIAEKDSWQEKIASLAKEYGEKKVALEASLPDVPKHLADFEDKKNKLQSELDEKVSTIASASDELDAVLEKLASAQKDFDFMNAKVTEKIAQNDSLDVDIAQKNAIIGKIITTIDESKAINEKTDSQKQNLVAINQSVAEGEAKLSSIHISIVEAQSQLDKKKEESEKIDLESNEKIKNLSILEQRIDQKLEIFKQYKEKFVAEEFAKMKISPDLV